MIDKTVLLVIAGEGFQFVEYSDTKKEIEAAGLAVVTASDVAQSAKGHNDVEVSIDLVLEEVDTKKYDGVFLIGGPGALKHLDIQEIHRILNEMMIAQKPFGAICIAPRILAKAHVIVGKRATGWNNDNELETIFPQNNVTYIPEPVVVDGNVVTADGPSSAEAFGKEIVKILQ